MMGSRKITEKNCRRKSGGSATKGSQPGGALIASTVQPSSG